MSYVNRAHDIECHSEVMAALGGTLGALQCFCFDRCTIADVKVMMMMMILVQS